MSQGELSLVERELYEKGYRRGIADALERIQATQVIPTAVATDMKEAIRLRVELLAQATAPSPRPMRAALLSQSFSSIKNNPAKNK